MHISREGLLQLEEEIVNIKQNLKPP